MGFVQAKNRASVAVDVGFVKKPGMRLLRLIFSVLAKVSPRSAAALSLRLFLTPQRHRIPSWQKPFIASAERQALTVAGKKVVVYTWGKSSKKILLCHSWGGRGTQLAAFVKPLLDLGYTVFAFDAPAHGQSTGRQTDMMEYSATIHELVRSVGPFYGIIGHSFGAGNALLAKREYGFPAEKMALIGCFAHGSWVTDRFGEALNIPSAVIARMRRLLEERYGGRLQWERLAITDMVKAESARILLVHDKDDKEVPYSHAQLLITACSGKAELYTTEGLGHRRILRDPSVLVQICDFFGAQAIASTGSNERVTIEG